MLDSLRTCESRHFTHIVTAQTTLQKRARAGDRYRIDFSCGRARGPAAALHNRYTVEMNSEAIERIETKIAFLESANVELSDVVYRQQQEIRALRARVDALAQRIEAAQTAEPVRTLEEERPPHY
jgi:SlyX protein